MRQLNGEKRRRVLTKIVYRAKATNASARAGRFRTKVESGGADLECFAGECDGGRSVKVARNLPDINQSIHQRDNPAMNILVQVPEPASLEPGIWS